MFFSNYIQDSSLGNTFIAWAVLGVLATIFFAALLSQHTKHTAAAPYAAAFVLVVLLLSTVWWIGLAASYEEQPPSAASAFIATVSLDFSGVQLLSGEALQVGSVVVSAYMKSVEDLVVQAPDGFEIGTAHADGSDFVPVLLFPAEFVQDGYVVRNTTELHGVDAGRYLALRAVGAPVVGDAYVRLAYFEP